MPCLDVVPRIYPDYPAAMKPSRCVSYYTPSAITDMLWRIVSRAIIISAVGLGLVNIDIYPGYLALLVSNRD
jgi:hypothetical protein